VAVRGSPKADGSRGLVGGVAGADGAGVSVVRAVLFTDLEDSTVLWELYPEGMGAALASHDRLLEDAVASCGGRVFKRTGDGIGAVFDDVDSAVGAAEQMQRSLAGADWPVTPPLKARIAVDAGEVEERGGDLFGSVVNRCARIMASGHGGQVLLSEAAASGLALSEAWQVRGLGEFRFKGLGRPQEVFQLVVAGLPDEFAPLRIDRLPPPLPGTAFGRTVRGYELREQVGAGDFGIVYRAYQPSVGREVAVKVIRPEYVDQPAFVRRFEAEAQLVARLEHPHIVALYDYWRDPDGAYLVMRWLGGGSLRQALDRGPFHPPAALAMLRQVGGALSHAHRQGVAHRDLKPGNVILDSDGNAYLTDFGIAARLVDASEAGHPYATSPAYVPPEELRGEPVTTAADVYGLGMLIFEVFTGHRPPLDRPLPPVADLRSDLPAGLDEVIGRATADHPGDRFGSVAELVAAVQSVFGEVPAPEETGFTLVRNPYKGLHAFFEGDAVDFYGRDGLVAEILEGLAGRRLVAVVGPSGSGKSSVVRAGLVPALRAGGLAGSREWLVCDMFPGSFPFEELAAALLKVSTEAIPDLAEDLGRDGRGLLRVSKRLVPAGGMLVLVVDQFEELFTLCRDDETRRRFLDGLVAVASDQRSRVRVILTLRADFFDRPLGYPGFGEVLKQGLVAVTALTDPELTAAIEKPARGVGVRLEPGLVDRILADLADQPLALPLLQYALTETFAGRRSDTITVDDYTSSGGIAGAVASRAEDIYQTLDENDRQLCRQIFLRLVTVSDQTEDTRRRVRRSELAGLGNREAVDRILDGFGERRLLSFDRDPETRDPTVEVAHEALLDRWERLAEWIDQQREHLILHGRFRGAVDEWLQAGRSPEFLLSGGRLAQFAGWADQTGITLTPDETDYLTQSRQRDTQQKTRRRRLRRIVFGALTALTAIALAFALYATSQRNQAQTQAEIAQSERDRALTAEATAEAAASAEAEQRAIADEQRAVAEEQFALARSREFAMLSDDNLAVDPERSILFALEGMDVAASVGRQLDEPVTALRQALLADRIVERIPGGDFVAYSPDGSLLATALGTDTAIWDADTAEQIRMLPSPEGRFAWHADFSPDGRLLAFSYEPLPVSTSEPGRRNPRRFGLGPLVIVWDVATGDEMARYEAPAVIQPRAVFTPDGTALAIETIPPGRVRKADQLLVVWDFASGVERYRIDYGVGHTAGGASFSPDGALLALSDFSPDGARVVVHDAAIGVELDSYDPGDRGPWGKAFDPAGGRLAAISQQPGHVQVWDVAGRDLILDQPLHGGEVALEWSPDGTTLAVAGNEGVPYLLDAVSGEEVLSLVGHGSGVWSLAFSPDGSRLAGAGLGSYTLIWDVTAGGSREVDTVATPFRALDFVIGVRYDAAGDSILLVGSEAEVRGRDSEGLARIDAETGEVQAAIHEQGLGYPFIPLVFPHAGMVESLTADGEAALHDAETFTLVHTLPDGYFAFDVSADGERALLSNLDWTEAFVAEVGTWKPLVAIETGQAFGWFSLDGSLVTGYKPSTGYSWLIDVDARSYLASTLGDADDVYSLVPWLAGGFSPDGSLLLVRTMTGRVGLLDVAKLRSGIPPEEAIVLDFQAHDGPVPDNIPFSRDGSMFATWGVNDRRLRVWQTDDGGLVADLGETEVWPGFDFHPNGRHLLVSGPSGTLRVHTLDVDELVDIAQERLTRGFTADECAAFGIDPCPDLDTIRNR
jgi:WD40 repeat protein/class 3 adenylate cyclase/tRNA A-37 threonylcarbamoyl transferase component Bud32